MKEGYTTLDFIEVDFIGIYTSEKIDLKVKLNQHIVKCKTAGLQRLFALAIDKAKVCARPGFPVRNIVS